MAATFDPVSLATGQPLGPLPAASETDVADAVERARGPQPLWAQVPAHARARYLRRTAQAILDELDTLADLLAEETGIPRTEGLLAELLPSVGGLHGLAEDGPGALADKRMGRIPALRAGRRSTLLQAPVGVVGVRGGTASPWAEATLEVGAALLAGDGVVYAPSAHHSARRLLSALERAGVPEGLVQIVHGPEASAALDEHCEHVSEGISPTVKGTMLVLDGAPAGRTVPGALWAAFAGAGRHEAAVGRVIVTSGEADALARGLEAGARRLRVGDPRQAGTEVGPLRSGEDLACLEELLADARDRGAEVLCGGAVKVDGLQGTFFAPAVLRRVPRDARVLHEPVPGPVLSLVEASSEADAIAIAEGALSVSVWAGDRAHAERVARTLGAPLSWVNEHGVASPAAPVRLARHVSPRQLASQPTRLRSARWLPYDPSLVRASTAVARLMHGRESERFGALREGAIPLARTAARLAREALGR